jgi:toxin ParE1/3/4
MRQVVFATPAEIDLAQIMITSEAFWGEAASERYATLIALALEQIAEDPTQSVTRQRDDLRRGLRSFHLRHTRFAQRIVNRPAHVIYYRLLGSDEIEVVRIMHEPMEPGTYFARPSADE